MYGGTEQIYISIRRKRNTFFKLLKKIGKFEWTTEAKESFQKLKEYLASPPILVPPNKKEDMLLYISSTKNVVSTAIVVERKEPERTYKV